MTGVEFRALRTSNGLLQRDLAAAVGSGGHRALGEYALIGVSTIMDHEGQDVA